MGKHVFLISLFLGLLIALGGVVEGFGVIANNTFTIIDESLFTTHSCTPAACAEDSTWTTYPNNGLLMKLSTSGNGHLVSTPFYLSPAYRYDFNTTVFADYASTSGSGKGFKFGLSNSYFFVNNSAGNDNPDLFYVNNAGGHLIVNLVDGLQYDLSLVHTLNHVYVVVNGSIEYSEEYGYNGDNVVEFRQLAGTVDVPTNTFFWEAFNLTEIYQGYTANFTVRDEIGYFPIDNVLLKFFLYDNNNNILQSLTSENSMVQVSNLSGQEYVLVYHDSVFYPRTFTWTPAVPYENFTLFILNNSVSSRVVINVKDSLTTGNIAGARVKVSKSINFTNTLIFSGLTDDAGNAVIYVNTTDIYQVTVNKSNYQSVSKTLNNLEDTYTISLSRNSAVNLSSILDFFTYSYSPTNNLLTNGTYQDFVFVVTSSSGSLDWFSLNTTIAGTDYGNYSASAYGGTLYASTVPGVSGVVFNVTYRVKVSGYDNPYIIIVHYYIYDTTQASSTSFDKGMRDLKSSFTEGERVILVLVVSLLLFIALSIIGGGDVAFWGAIFVIGMFTYVGWLNNLVFVVIITVAFTKLVSIGQGRS